MTCAIWPLRVVALLGFRNRSGVLTFAPIQSRHVGTRLGVRIQDFLATVRAFHHRYSIGRFPQNVPRWALVREVAG